MTGPNEVIYYEGDALEHVLFVKSGACNYVLPMYANTPYIEIVNHTCFGLIDIVLALLERQDEIKDATLLSALGNEEEHVYSDKSSAGDRGNEATELFS